MAVSLLNPWLNQLPRLDTYIPDYFYEMIYNER